MHLFVLFEVDTSMSTAVIELFSIFDSISLSLHFLKRNHL